MSEELDNNDDLRTALIVAGVVIGTYLTMRVVQNVAYRRYIKAKQR